MLKFIYSLWVIVTFVALLVWYFQNIGEDWSIDFFNLNLVLPVFTIYMVIIAALFGAFLVLAIKSFTSSSKDIDDDFKL